LAAALYASASQWLPALGTFLVDAENPSPADAAIVLAGDYFGLRVEKGGDLVRSGLAPIALVSGPTSHYGRAESDLAIDWAAGRGYDRQYFVSIPNESTSTENEAIAMLVEARKRGFRKLLIVTSNYHTRRAGRIWRRLAGSDFEIHMVSAPDHDVVAPEAWWRSREARKKLFFEWTKTLTGPLGV
jgi:uncharacterized SAM-binding protein YcdF (DUF218 family)